MTSRLSPGTRQSSQRDAEEILRALLTHAPWPVVVIDNDGRIRGGWNDAAASLFGWTFREVKSRRLEDLLDPRFESGDPLGIAPRRELRGLPPTVARITDKAHESFPVVISSTLFRNSSGQVSGAVVFFQDRSDRESLEAQLRQAQKLEAIGQLTGGIAHDFNNLLTIVQTNAELLGDRLSPAGPDAEHLADIQAAVRRGSQLVRRLMAFGRNDPAHFQILDVGELLSAYGNTLQRVLPDDIRVEVIVGPDVPLVRGDPGALQQIILNLATNAKDAMPQGGVLELEAVKATHTGENEGSDWAQVSVRDSGTGIPDDAMEHIFEPFFTTKALGQGTGLGLSMVQELTRQFGGSVTVTSEPGRGTEFRIQLPRAEGGEGETATRPVKGLPEEMPPASVGTGTVLVVEDDTSVRKVIRRALTGAGYEVIATADGEQAVQAFHAHQGGVDLVVSDLVMPNMDGATLYEELNESREHPIPFLFISGYGDQDARIDALLAKGVPILQKPWSVRQLCDAVQDARSGAV